MSIIPKGSGSGHGEPAYGENVETAFPLELEGVTGIKLKLSAAASLVRRLPTKYASVSGCFGLFHRGAARERPRSRVRGTEADAPLAIDSFLR